MLQENAERSLYEAVQRLSPQVELAIEGRDYTGALTALASVRAEVDEFFDQVMVMAEDDAVRANRLALLSSLGDLMNTVADISKLAV